VTDAGAEQRPAEAGERRPLSVHIDPFSDPIRGIVDDGSGPHPFEGWIELTRVLEHQRCEPRHAVARPQQED